MNLNSIPALVGHAHRHANHVRVVDAPPEAIDAAKQALTVRPPPSPHSRHGDDTIPLWWTEAGALCMPRFAGQKLTGMNMTPVGWGEKGSAWAHETHFGLAAHRGPALRPEQKTAVKTALKTLTLRGGVTIVLPCGAGKTFVGASIARLMGVKTAVLAHQGNLLEQWRQAFEALCPVKMGVVKASKIQDGEVLLVSTPTLISRGAECLPPDIGLVIIDECHHVCAPSTRMAISQLDCKYIVGLTATPSRADRVPCEYWCGPRADIQVTVSSGGSGPRRSIQSLMGLSGAQVHIERVPLTVHQINTGIGNGVDVTTRDGTVMLPRMVSYLALSRQRFALVRALLEDWSQRHHVIALSDRKQILEHLAECLGDRAALCTGDQTADEQRAAITRKPRVLLATGGVAREGLDAPYLSCVLLLTPNVRIEQSVGRVQRQYPGKKEAVVLDLVDNYPTLGHWARARKKRYEALGASVHFHMQPPTPPK